MSLKLLKKKTKDDAERFTLKGLKVSAKAVYVYDGDTLDLMFYRMKELVRFKCRLLNVDAAELRESNGKLVRNFLAHLCLGKDPKKFDSTTTWNRTAIQKMLDRNRTKLLYAMFEEFDKYGRALVTLKTSRDGKSINSMIAEFVTPKPELQFESESESD